MVVTVRVPATTANLGSGFDAIGAALDWHSFVSLSPADSIQVTVKGEGSEVVSRDDRNIAVQAVQALLAQVPLEVGQPLRRGFHLRLDNRFPLTRGLGSSAAARVGALVAANHLLGQPLTTAQLLSLATELEGHADNVAAALLGGIVVAVVSGEGIAWVRFLPPVPLHLALLIPDFPLETKEARAVLPKAVPFSDAVFNVGRAALLAAALATGQVSPLATAMQDRLHQPYREQLVPWLSSVFEAALKAGALGVHLSGAGPTVAAWCPSPSVAETVAAAMWQSLSVFGLQATWRLAQIDPYGATVVQGVEG